MTHVVTENCIKCKYTSCVDVCPVSCFREGKNMLVIDPDLCIDCGVCIPECDAYAIIPESADALVVEWMEINKRMSEKWPLIKETKWPLEDADEWNGKSGKKQYLEE